MTCRRLVRCFATWTHKLVVRCHSHELRTYTKNLTTSSRKYYWHMSVCLSVCLSLTRAENVHKEPDDIITYVLLAYVCLSVCLSLTRAENVHKEPDDIITYVLLAYVCLSVCLSHELKTYTKSLMTSSRMYYWHMSVCLSVCHMS